MCAASYRSLSALRGIRAYLRTPECADEILAVLFHQLGRHREARSHFAAPLRIEPDSGVAHFNFGRLLEETGDRAGAINHFRRAATLMRGVERIQTALDSALRRGAESERR